MTDIADVAASRRIEQRVCGRETSDGAGVRLTRVLTRDLQGRLDPFLMMDAFRNEPKSGSYPAPFS